MSIRSAGLTAARFIAPLFKFRAAQIGVANSIRFLEALQGVGTGAVFTERELAAIFDLVKAEAPVIFDVGAHTGQFLKEALERTASDCTIHAFEPATASFRELSNIFRDEPRAQLNRVALSSVVGSGVLFYDEPDSQLASLTPRPRSGNAKSEAVALETLDSYCQTHDIGHIELLKMDVEGHELEVLEGAIDMLGKEAIHHILLEFSGCNVDTRVFFRDIYEFLNAKGMKLARLSPGGVLCRIENYDESLERFHTTNYLATL